RRRRGGGGDGSALHAVAGRQQGRRASARSAAAAGATAGAAERTEAAIQKAGPRGERKLSDSSSPRTFDAVRPGVHSGRMTTATLYERLGGVYSIAVVVDDFIDRIMDDARLNANAKVDEAHHRVSRAGFKYLVTEMVCWATGGPQCYSGRSMADSHAHLG